MTDKHDSSRRLMLKTAGLGLAAAGALPAARVRAAMEPGAGPLSMSDDGTYAVVPLAKDSVRLAVAQTRVRAVDAASPERGLRENLDHTLDAIDKVFHFAAPADILQFHEFPLTGFDTWSRKEILRLALEIPGAETEEIGKKAKEYNCYIVFGSYAVDKDWPNHVLSITAIIGPDGKVADKHWKARNIKGVFPGVELFTTTIYDVLDEYREMYGEDAVIPVTRTPYGNLATSSVQREPELFRAFAMKGAEIYLRTATGGFSETDVSATIPIASFRNRHRQPIVHQELYAPVRAGYRNPYGPNLFSAYQPADLYDAKDYLSDKSRWR